MKNIIRIDALRFYLVLSIVFGHLMQHFIFKINPELYNVWSGNITFYFGYACEMLFVISGFFLTMHFNGEAYSTMSLIHFIGKKYIRLSVVILFSVPFYIVFNCLDWHKTSFFDIILQILLITDTGMGGKGFPFLWYISVMFWVLPIYLFLFMFTKKYFVIITAFIIFIAYSLISATCGNNWYSKQAAAFLSVFMLRGLGGVGIGCLIGVGLKSSQMQGVLARTVCLRDKYLFSIIELLSFFFLVYIINIKGVKHTTPLIYPISFIFIFILFLSGKGYFSSFLDRKIFSHLNQCGYAMYVMSFPSFLLCKKLLIDPGVIDVLKNPMITVAIVMLMTFLLGAFTHYFIELPGTRLLHSMSISKSRE